jgi:hypothetical protein
MESEARAEASFFVRICRRGPEAFGWEICHEVDSTVVHRAARMFRTRIEAIADSARAAATLSIAVEPSS